MELQGVWRRGIDLVGNGDLGQRHLHAVDLGGRAHHAPLGLFLGCGHFDLKVVDQCDKETSGIRGKLGRLFRPSDSHGRDLRVSGLSLSGVVHGPGKRREVDVLGDRDRLAGAFLEASP